MVLSGEWRRTARKKRSLRRSSLSVDSINIRRNRAGSVGWAEFPTCIIIGLKILSHLYVWRLLYCPFFSLGSDVAGAPLQAPSGCLCCSMKFLGSSILLIILYRCWQKLSKKIADSIELKKEKLFMPQHKAATIF